MPHPDVTTCPGWDARTEWVGYHKDRAERVVTEGDAPYTRIWAERNILVAA